MFWARIQPFYPKGLIIGLLLSSLILPFFQCFANIALDEQTEQKIFLKAEHAIRTNNPALAKLYLDQLQTIPLYSYLEYQLLKKELEHNKNKQSVFYAEPIHKNHISEYRRRYPDSPLSKSLLHLWLNQQAHHKQWKGFLEVLEPTDSLSHSVGLQCYKIQAQYHANPTPEALSPGVNLWMALPEPPSECNALIELLQAHNLITQDKLLEKYQILLEKRTATSLTLAKKLQSKMNPEYQKIAQLWETWMSHPAKLADKKDLEHLKQHKNKILVSCFKQYAKNHVHQAKTDFEENMSSLKLSLSEKGDIIKQIALSLALQHNKQAMHWFKKIPAISFDAKTKAWQIRTAIKEKNWHHVLEIINQLDAVQAQQESWQYWKARSLENLELPNHQNIYQSLALKRSYYGFLAAERIRHPIHLNHNPHPEVPEAVAQLEKRPAIARAKALFKLNRPHEAHREWYHMVASMNDLEKTYAARLAKRLKWHHLAIYTFNQSHHKDDVILRFPLAFESLFLKQAETHQMDSAWLFAIARQESNFNPLALSPVGAVGLMQLMPKTAYSIDNAKPLHLSSPHTNLHLGTRYLKSLYEQSKHPIIATASYNAGPSRVKRWLPAEPCEADIWIETIPYEETRNYVKNVLTLTCIYKHLQNKPFSLSRMMPVVDSYQGAHPTKT